MGTSQSINTSCNENKLTRWPLNLIINNKPEAPAKYVPGLMMAVPRDPEMTPIV